MKRWILRLVGLLAVPVVVAVGLLGYAHLQIRRLAPDLPSDQVVLALSSEPDLPVRLAVIHTASQVAPRSQVLDPARDPAPDEAYVMSHPAFALRWQDGRILLIDTGMTPDAARRFGKTLELVGAAPAEPHGSLVEQLGAAVTRVEAVLFTHLHTDHTDGVGPLCGAVGPRRITLFQTPGQAELTNHMTWAGRAHLEQATCLESRRLDAAALAPVPGFPGVGVIHAAGHTPGSQMVVAAVGSHATRLYAFAGDVVNHVDGIRHDVPKPLLYRLLVVPESDGQLARLRTFLARLERQAGARLVVSHHFGQIESLMLDPIESLGQGLD